MKLLHGGSGNNDDFQELSRSQNLERTAINTFGRLFPSLPPFKPSLESLEKLGNAMEDPSPETPDGDNKTVPAGYTYLGQFIDHDITLDTTSLQEAIADPTKLQNFRTPKMDLDSLYGAGPNDQAYLYEFTPGLAPQEKFLIGTTNEAPGGGDATVPVSQPNDLPRINVKRQTSRLGILGDSRNDENLIVAQMHVAFLKFHNKVIDAIQQGRIKPEFLVGKTRFEQARNLVTWHYQWIVLNDFLPRILDREQLKSVRTQGRKFFKADSKPELFPFMPVEFSVAAYRLGHSMIRAVYNYNRVFTPLPGGVTPATLELLFQFTAKSGSGSVPVPIPSDWMIDWRRFFEFTPTVNPKVGINFSRKLDTKLVDPLKNLPNVPPPNSLAVRNLLRGRQLGLPDGQSVAKLMGFKPLTPAEISQGSDGAVAKTVGLDVQTPLWYYILKEAQVQASGKHLGQVGSRIVAEVFVGLLQEDERSFLSQTPNWKPMLPAKTPGTFTMVDLLNFVGDLNPVGDKPFS